MCLFQFSTCFEQTRAHHQENQLYQYNIRYTRISLCVCDLFVCRSELRSDLHTKRDTHTHQTLCCRITTNNFHNLKKKTYKNF